MFCGIPPHGTSAQEVAVLALAFELARSTGAPLSGGKDSRARQQLELSDQAREAFQPLARLSLAQIVASGVLRVDGHPAQVLACLALAPLGDPPEHSEPSL